MGGGKRGGRPAQQVVRRRNNPLKRLKALLLGNANATSLELTEDHILSLLLVRRARDSVFSQDLFSDPAWDILLELYAANLTGRKVSLRELALAIRAPVPTTARWIAALAEHALVESNLDPLGSPNLQIMLSAKGARKMKGLADHWGSAFVSI